MCPRCTKKIRNTKRQPARPGPSPAQAPGRDGPRWAGQGPRGPWLGPGLGRSGCRLVFCIYLVCLGYLEYILDICVDMLGIFLVYSFLWLTTSDRKIKTSLLVPIRVPKHQCMICFPHLVLVKENLTMLTLYVFLGDPSVVPNFAEIIRNRTK